MPASSEHAGVVAPPPLIFAGGLALGLSWHLTHPVAFLPQGFAVVGAAFVAAAGLLIGWALRTMRDAGTRPEPWKSTTAIVDGGPYAYSRNPMYVGMTLLYVGITVMLNALWPLVVLPGVLALIVWGVVAREERYLAAKFGDDYRRYAARVRRWV